jgi:hypothetical protein
MRSCSGSRLSDLVSTERFGDFIIAPSVAPSLSLRHDCVDCPPSFGCDDDTHHDLCIQLTFFAINRPSDTHVAIGTFSARNPPRLPPTFPTRVHGRINSSYPDGAYPSREVIPGCRSPVDAIHRRYNPPTFRMLEREFKMSVTIKRVES